MYHYHITELGPQRSLGSFEAVDGTMQVAKSRMRCTLLVDGAGEEQQRCEYEVAYNAQTLRAHLAAAHGENAEVLAWLAKNPAISRPGARKKRQSVQTTLGVRTTFVGATMTSEQQQELSRYLATIIVEDCLPFSAFERPAMRRFFAKYFPAYRVPARSTFIRNYIPSLLQGVSDRVEQLLSSCSTITLATDGWKRRNGAMSLNCVVAYCPTPILVGLFPALGSQTSAAQAEMLESVLAGPILATHASKLSAIVTDNARSIQSARQQVAVVWPGVLEYRCVAHGVNLFAQDLLALPCLAAFVHDCRQLNFALTTPTIVQ